MENNILDDNSDLFNVNKPRIYSKRAILGFSVFFTTVFGGVLLMQNLLNINRKKEAYIILAGSVLFTVLSIVIIDNVQHTGSALTYACNFAGGFTLAEVLQKKYFPDERNYEIKKIWKALIIAIIVTIPFIVALFYQ
ncbi:MAG: hypothetical protein U0U67_07085 [Chitinophagales bacterium]